MQPHATHQLGKESPFLHKVGSLGVQNHNQGPGSEMVEFGWVRPGPVAGLTVTSLGLNLQGKPLSASVVTAKDKQSFQILIKPHGQNGYFITNGRREEAIPLLQTLQEGSLAGQSCSPGPPLRRTPVRCAFCTREMF